MYVVVMMALAEALSAQGTVLGALFTLLLYGALPLSIVMYLLGTPARWRARRQADADAAAAAAPDLPDSAPADGDGGSHASGAGRAPEGEKP
jgi:hypothetical protein